MTDAEIEALKALVLALESKAQEKMSAAENAVTTDATALINRAKAALEKL